jgi:hypothetical protein
MTQINSIKLGVIVMCVATVTLSLAQTPRIGTGGSNQTGSTNRAPAGHSGLSGNVTSAAQLGTNLPSSMSTGVRRPGSAIQPVESSVAPPRDLVA